MRCIQCKEPGTVGLNRDGVRLPPLEVHKKRVSMARHHCPRQREAHEQEMKQTRHRAGLSQGWTRCKFCFFFRPERAH